MSKSTMYSPINVLLIEDSGFMRILISDVLRKDPAIRLMATANNGKEGVDKVKKLRPDVIITDIMMPDFDGLYVVGEVMKHCPTPVILLSSLDRTDKQVFDALDLGAFDFIDKPKNIQEEKGTFVLTELVKAAAAVDTDKLLYHDSKRNTHQHTFDQKLNYQIIVIGASTGGPAAIEIFIEKLPENLPVPIIIAQHMPERFIDSFAARLNQRSSLPVRIPKNGEAIQGGVIYLAPGHANLEIISDVQSKKPIAHFSKKKFKEFNHPSVDCLFKSVSKTFGGKAIGVLLTGMGRDGTQGAVELKKQGSFMIAQDAQTAVIYGMPQSAIKEGCIDRVVKLHEMPNFIVTSL
ncbi:chemotaxis-specific protein-glutamate methyltransferase CheB [Rapidithrix thailandica]|uniref:Protein-glutamate methylesterase/protein-glutamine glutaminase n=1 Tax=Rapidithrix thailandica TaxID=413964 RepID=A0AAW9SCF7_9BACT